MIREILAAAALALVCTQAAQAENIRIATEGAYPPFNLVDASGQLKGFDVDIAKALCTEMKAHCTIVAQAWDGIIPGLKAGKYDAIVASMSITDKRKKAVDFTAPYYVAGAVLVAPADSKITFTPEGLKGKSIGVQRATTYAALLKAEFPGADVKLYDTVENQNLDLKAGRLDGVVAQQVVMYEWLKKQGGDAFAIKGKPYLNPKYIGAGAGIAVNKGNTKLRDQFDAALKTIMANGTYAKINAKYFPFSIAPK